jgi:hypothetical protein
MAKNMGSPIVRRRSRPQTAHTRIESITERERCSTDRGLELLQTVLTFSHGNSDDIQPNNYMDLDSTLSLIDFGRSVRYAGNNIRSH